MLPLLAAIPTVSLWLRNPVASASHFFWCLFSAFVALFLVRLARKDRLKAISLGIFGASMVLLYFASGLYHALMIPDETLRWFRSIDHSAIYLLIAGSYTPVAAVMLRGAARITLLSTVWTLAALGIASVWLFTMPPYPVTVGLYIAMGWVGLMQLPALLRVLGYRGVGFIILGGCFYMLGGIADALKWPDLWPGIVGPHEVLHVSDMVGTAIHIQVMLWYVVPFHRGD